jgi:hypothetical protein
MATTINIDRNAVYQLYDAATVCNLKLSALQAAIKAGELPATKRSRNYFIEGETLWRWITGRPHTEQGASRG